MKNKELRKKWMIILSTEQSVTRDLLSKQMGADGSIYIPYVIESIEEVIKQ
jgi:hypothetical protein